MGASASACFPTVAACDKWAKAQKELAYHWKLQNVLDFGNQPVLRIPIIRGDMRDELAVPRNPLDTLDDRVAKWLADAKKFYGWRVDPGRERENGWQRCIRFDV